MIRAVARTGKIVQRLLVIVAALDFAAGAAAAQAVTRAATPGTQLWVQRYDGPAHGYDSASAVAVSPGGRRVFVTGFSKQTSSGFAYATVAYSSATGARLWVSRYDGPAGSDNYATALAVSPGGRRLFVTGGGATVAYNTITGAQLWARRYNGGFQSIAVSPNGAIVVVTGNAWATVAYSVATGKQLWARRYAGPSGVGYATSVAISSTGSAVYVTGTSLGDTSHGDYATLAYDASTGARIWVSRYNGPANGYDYAWSLAVSPSAGTVYVTGTSDGGASLMDYATVAYDGVTGAQLWVSRYNGAGDNYDGASAITISPNGTTLIVTGVSVATSGYGYATVSYNPVTGAQLWASQYKGNVTDISVPHPAIIALSPGGSSAYIAGTVFGPSGGKRYVTVAYNTATGTQQWVRYYNGPGHGPDAANSVAVSPTAGTVFVTGSSYATASNADYATVAYHG